MTLLIANSGVGGPQMPEVMKNGTTPIAELAAALLTIPSSEWTDTLTVNTTAMFYTCVTFLPLLDAGNARKNVSQKSQIIATGSINAFLRQSVTTGFAYHASKAGSHHLIKMLATNLAQYQIRCNVLAPGCELTGCVVRGRADCQQSLSLRGLGRLHEGQGGDQRRFLVRGGFPHPPRWQRGGDGRHDSLHGQRCGWLL